MLIELIKLLNNYLKELKVRYIVFWGIAFAVTAQVLDLNFVPYKNYRLLEEMFELLAALCLFTTIFRIKSLITSPPVIRIND